MEKKARKKKARPKKVVARKRKGPVIKVTFGEKKARMKKTGVKKVRVKGKTRIKKTQVRKPARKSKVKKKPSPSKVRKPVRKKVIKKGKVKIPEKPKGSAVVVRGGIIYLETNVDRLLRMVKRNGEVRVKEAAKVLGVTEDRIKDWGEILESHKLVHLHYPPIGRPSLRLKKEGKSGRKSS